METVAGEEGRRDTMNNCKGGNGLLGLQEYTFGIRTCMHFCSELHWLLIIHCLEKDCALLAVLCGNRYNNEGLSFMDGDMGW